ncbi:MAG TPA: hypothetical protein VJP86_18150 [Vicinamibacterales bacterium]|nr:hypothetical protein [Vicinamibacterales bacterium]
MPIAFNPLDSILIAFEFRQFDIGCQGGDLGVVLKALATQPNVFPEIFERLVRSVLHMRLQILEVAVDGLALSRDLRESPFDLPKRLIETHRRHVS